MAAPQPGSTGNPLLDQLQQALGKLPAGKSGEGWGALDPLSPENKAAQARRAQERFEQAHIIAAPFMTPAGQACLNELRRMTYGQAMFPVDDLGLVNAIGFGIARDGQNSLVRYIERQIEVAQQGPTGTAPVRKKRGPT